MTKIEFLYFDGCPSHEQALRNLKDTLQSLGLETEPRSIRVESPEAAKKLGFLGSPSIKINGVDLEQSVLPASYTCRLYEIDGKMNGLTD